MPISGNESHALFSHNPSYDRGALWVDLTLLILVIAVFVGAVEFGREWFASSHPTAGTNLEIDLRLTALPSYAMMSFTRGVLAYCVSLAFSLLVGGLAARNRIAERIIIPLLDVLQGIPVLGFMPGIIITMVSIFPRNNVGLELSCILMIFTAQVWNLTFAFYGAVRSVPAEYREVGKMHNFSSWRVFRSIELPVAAIPMVWNSMMSMAGGWFFLTVNEAFTLGSKDYRVPGIGSYMSTAIEAGDTPAICSAILAMCTIILISDRLIWNPLSIWAQKFRMDESSQDVPTSPIIQILRRSLALRKLRGLIARRREFLHDLVPLRFSTPPASSLAPKLKTGSTFRALLSKSLAYLILLLTLLAMTWAFSKVAILSSQVTFREWIEIFISLGFTFLRTVACLALSVLWAIPIGIIIGRNSRLARKLQPVVQLLASFPAPMLYPLVVFFIASLDINFEWGCTLLMILGAQWYVLFNTIAGAQTIPSDLHEVGTVFKMSATNRWFKVYLPAIFPSLLTGLVTAAGGAWNASIVSELVKIRGKTLIATGLGSLIAQATESGNMPLLCASVAVMAATLVCVNRLIWKPLFKLADQRFSMNR